MDMTVIFVTISIVLYLSFVSCNSSRSNYITLYLHLQFRPVSTTPGLYLICIFIFGPSSYIL